VRHWDTWEAARAEYGAIDRPVLLLYGDHDWSRDDEHAADVRAIPGAKLRIIPDAGHFLSLDAPEEMLAEVGPWLGRLRGPGGHSIRSRSPARREGAHFKRRKARLGRALR
jgi:hypothetical protein